MNQRDRITMAMMYPEMAEGLEPPGAPPAPIAPGDMPPPMPYRHNPRNLLHNGAGSAMSPEWMEKLLRSSRPPEYNEWDKIPAANPPLVEGGNSPPLPPEVIPPDAPDWATRGGEPPFLRYMRPDEEV